MWGSNCCWLLPGGRTKPGFHDPVCVENYMWHNNHPSTIDISMLASFPGSPTPECKHWNCAVVVYTYLCSRVGNPGSEAISMLDTYQSTAEVDSTSVWIDTEYLITHSGGSTWSVEYKYKKHFQLAIMCWEQNVIIKFHLRIEFLWRMSVP